MHADPSVFVTNVFVVLTEKIMNRLRSMVVVVCFVTLAQVTTQAAGFQTMAIPRGTVLKLSPKSIGKVNAFCLDPHLKAPAPGLNYGNVITGGTEGIVKIGSRQMSLQRAV